MSVRIFSKGKKNLNPVYAATPRFEVLKDQKDYIQATEMIQDIGLSGHHDPQKNWDLWLSIDSSRSLSKKSYLLDAGSGSKAVFANSMAELGFKNSHACDLQRAKGKKIVSSIQDISNTNYESGFFDFIACHSVIEHGVDLRLFLEEMFRISKPGASFGISTDFWPEFEDYSTNYPYGEDSPPMMLFNNDTIHEFLKTAHSVGWTVPTFINIEEFNPRPVYWPRMDARFTFIWLKLVKPI
jgi:SAM-dependent methyltransferase